MKRQLKIGCIGLGERGRSLIKKLTKIPGNKVTALFDLQPNMIETTLKIFEELELPKPKVYSSSEELLSDKKNVDAVIIATSWAAHIPLACSAMEKGIIVGMEVAPAMSIQDCFKLVETYEKTKTPFMFLENCCFGRDELFAINMIKNGMFGEIVHATGAYQHCCAELVYNEYKNSANGGPGNERILTRLNRNMEPYPTHGLGPAAKGLNINRGNRMLSLTSMASKAVGFESYVKKTVGNEEAAKLPHTTQGDVITTMIKCAHGETILLTYNTLLPAPYSRGLKFHGTNGMYNADLKSLYIEGVSPEKLKFEPQSNYDQKYKHPGWVWFDKNDYMTKYNISSKGHGDLDYLTMFVFVECARNGYDFPVDVYDAASWMAVSVLVEESLAIGGAPVFFPDFTNGKWMRREKLNIDERWNCCL